MSLTIAGVALLGQVHWGYVVLMLAMFLLRDWGECYSPGKRLFGLATVRSFGGPCTMTASVVRNATLLPPALFVELALLLFSTDGVRLGEKFSFTRVTLMTPPAEQDATSPEAKPAEATAADTAELDAEMIEPDLLPAGTAGAEGSTIDTVQPAGEHPEPPPTTEPSTPAPRPIDPALAAKCIGIAGEVSYDSLDDAYWRYVDRYSLDTAEKLTDEELRGRCAELATREAEPSMSAPKPPADGASRDDCLRFLNEWLVIVNKCRDALS